MRVAIVHDYLTQRGGAERVVLSLTRAFPDAPVFTSLYDPDGTFPEFGDIDIRTLPMNRLAPLRRHHRPALPILASSFSRLKVTADAVVCSSSGWAHGASVEGRKIVYCHTPARWLYQPDRYLRGHALPVRAAARFVQARLERWDKRAAASADLYVANSTVVARRIKSLYGLEAEVVPPAPAVTEDGPMQAPRSIEPGFILCVSRLLSYKNVEAVIRAFGTLDLERLVIAGGGPDEQALRALAGRNVTMVGRVTDEELRWLYANCKALVAASHEDFGLTPLEAAAFGKPTAALHWGGFRDTVEEGRSGVFFHQPNAHAIADGIRRTLATRWNEETIRAVSDGFSEARFRQRMRDIVAGNPIIADEPIETRAQVG